MELNGFRIQNNAPLFAKLIVEPSHEKIFDTSSISIDEVLELIDVFCRIPPRVILNL